MKKLYENKDGPETSEFFRIAGYYGWPNDYSHHGNIFIYKLKISLYG